MNHLASEALTRAKATLILDQPFFASILLSMAMVESSDIAQLSVDGDVIKYNPEYLQTLKQPEVIWALAHETLHCVLQHMYRRGERDHQKWNQACDYVVNDLLAKEKIGVAPIGVLRDDALVLQGNGTAEGVYPLIKNKDGDKDGNAPVGAPGGAFDNIEEPTASPAELSDKEAEMRVKVVQAKNAAKMQGKLSAGLDRLVKEAVFTETDWRSVLRRFLSERARVDLSYAKPKRRFMADDLYLPSLIGEKMGRVAVAVDCSGSIGEADLALFESEIKQIFQDVCPSEVLVLYFDTEICGRETFTCEEPVKLKARGGGGTAFSPIFKELAKEESAPVACIVLTDLYCSDFGAQPDYPVLWASTSTKEKVPFGEVTRVKPGRRK